MDYQYLESSSFWRVAENRKRYEIQLQLAWSVISRNKRYKTEKGLGLKVMSPGTWNVEAGPDFKNAKLLIGDDIVTGDVEIHMKSSDWFHHGHDRNPAYDGVILHVVAESSDDDSAKPDITTLILEPHKNQIPLADARKVRNGKCVDLFNSMTDDDVRLVMEAAGKQRFEMKSFAIAEDMLKYGAETTFLKLLFDAVGYKENRENFVELFLRFNRYDPEIQQGDFEAILWGESGLLPDPVAVNIADELADFVSGCWKRWWKIRQASESEIPWKRSSVRPLNTPERRLAALTVILRKWSLTPLAVIREMIDKDGGHQQFWKRIRKGFSVHHPIWDRYSNFFDRRSSEASVLGEQRVLDIAVNVILPSLHALATLENNTELANFAENAWLNLPKTQSNRVIKNASCRWFIPPERSKSVVRNAASAQGMLFLYRNFCENNQTDCRNCDLVIW